MTRTIRRLFATTGLLIAAIPGVASAQVQAVLYGSGEWDTEDQAVYVLGLAAQTTRLGLGPTINLLGYHVALPGEPGGSIQAFNPQAGLQYRWNQSALQGRVGYVFVRGDTANATSSTFGGSESGLSTTAQYEYWGDGSRMMSLIGNMNWGDEYFFVQGRAAQRILATGSGGLALGAEAVAQGNSASKVYQVGPLAEMSFGKFKVNGVVGYKIRDDAFDNGPYFKLGFVLVH